MESIDFSYAGQYSSDFGIYNVSLDSGMFEDQFSAPRTIIETKIRGNPKPYVHGVEYEPITLKLSFAFADTWDEAKIREVARWLCGQEYYKPLWFAENPTRLFYCMCVDESILVHNGLKQGYITLTMRCDSPYTYTPFFTKGELDFSTITAPTTFEFANSGDVVCKPEVWITKIGDGGSVSLVNLSNGSREFKFSSTSLQNNEMIYVDNEREYIETNVPNVYRYKDFNNNFLELVRGRNILQVNGKCKIMFRYQFKTLQ